MRYFVEKPHEGAFQNKLFEAAHELTQEFNRYSFDVSELAHIQKVIVDALLALNAKYPRCKPVEPKWAEQKGFPVNLRPMKFQTKYNDWNLYLGANSYSSYLELKYCREKKDLK